MDEELSLSIEGDKPGTQRQMPNERRQMKTSGNALPVRNSKVVKRSFLILVLVLSGCGRSQLEFVHRDAFEDLVPEARAAAEAVLVEHFGTPTEMRIWEKLPLRHSAAVGRVVGPVSAQGGAVVGLKVQWQDEVWPIVAGQSVGWLSEELSIDDGTELPRVARYDPAEQTIIFEDPLALVPPAGTRLAVAPGRILHQGRLLYAEHCQHCHGVSGDGAGPTARYLNPLPRDYRDGKFKFSSTPFTHPPTRDDLARIIANGIPGTYMPSFKLLEPQEVDSLVEYVRFLAMRGQCEQLLIGELSGKTSVSTDAVRELSEFLAEEVEVVVAQYWIEAEQPEMQVLPETPRPPPTEESIARGRELFLSARAKCIDCHGAFALGDGFQTLQVEDAKGYTEPGLHDDWGQIVKPRNLRQGIYRGGRRPIDIYRRVAAGIKGTPMNGFKTSLYDVEGDRKDEDVWHVVNYVLNLPYEHFAPGEGIGAEVPPPAPPEQTAFIVR
jgi:mono/diheme cytochrome c family protein